MKLSFLPICFFFCDNSLGFQSTETLAKENENKNSTRRPVTLNMRQGFAMNQILSVYTLGEMEANQLCKNHSRELKLGLRAFEPWALQMFDASSKLQAGILDGNLVEFGAFRQCIGVYKNSEYGEIRGKHCWIKITPDVEILRKILEYRNITRRRFVKVYQFVKKAAFFWTICVPDSCNSTNILGHFSTIIYELTHGLNLSVSLTEDDCVTILDNQPLNIIELSAMIFLGSFLLIVAIFTIIQLRIQLVYTGKETNDVIKAFSVCENFKKICAKARSSDLDCVHGIRFLSTCYVVIGHRYLMLMFFPVINSLKIMDWVLYYRSTAITGGTLCVDTFFMVSGMLVSVGFFQQVAKQGQIDWGMFYLYRYMRITMPLAVVVLCYSTLVHHLGSGPLWHDMLNIVQKPCKEYWWATLLHVQNYISPFPLCMTQAWYLTCDMQFYFLSPFILVPLWKWPVFGYINFSVVYVLSVAANFYLAWINSYDGGVPVTNQLFSTKYFQHHYIAPHVRAATYILGLGFGYVVHKNEGKKTEMNNAIAVAGWLVAIMTMLASLVGCHTFHEENHDFNRLEASIYLSCSRSAWTLGIMWMVWACINGYGGPINSILSSHIFRVLARISYSIYLLHMLMQYLMSGAAKSAGYFSDFSALYAAFSDLFIMVVIGFVFTVCFESPLVKFFAIILKRAKTTKVQHKG